MTCMLFFLFLVISDHHPSFYNVANQLTAVLALHCEKTVNVFPLNSSQCLKLAHSSSWIFKI